jgi:hypothetical protein
MILSVLHHRQNAVDSTQFLVCLIRLECSGYHSGHTDVALYKIARVGELLVVYCIHLIWRLLWGVIFYSKHRLFVLVLNTVTT